MNPVAENSSHPCQYLRHGPSPEEALARLLKVKSQLGITRVADITGLDIAGIPAVQAVRPLSRSNLVSQGKGKTLADATISTILESSETFFAERLDHFKVTIASARELAVQPGHFARHMLDDVPAEWRDWQTAWTEATNRMTGKPDIVPFEFVHTAYAVPPYQYDGIFRASTTGLAVSFDERDGVVHGVLECIERDAIARALDTHGFFQRQRIDLASIDHPAVLELLATLASKGFLLGLWLAPSPVGIPVIWCHLMEDRPPETALLCHPAEGSAASEDLAAAMLCAIYEAAQSRLTAISGARDDFSRHRYPKYPDWQKIAAHRRLLSEGPKELEFGAFAEAAPSAETAPLDRLLRKLASAGIEHVYQITIDTHPVPDLAAVKIIIPQLLPLAEG